MLNPQICWIANARTIWTHLVFKHEGNLKRANEELELYRDDDETSDMAYKKLVTIHREIRVNLTKIVENVNIFANAAEVSPERLNISGPTLSQTPCMPTTMNKANIVPPSVGRRHDLNATG